ncbi:MAG: FAD-dependent oxidoreductase [Bacteroidota bacterium]|nr:FAD-dependent oxidoreductase [Bacteroidota bacterium]
MKYDTIIIGGGLGGLTAGAKLSKSEKKVLLIEQHSIPGGCATTFKRKDFTMEVGLHEMDGLHKKDMKSKIFRDLKVFDNVEFLKVPEFYRFLNNRKDIVIPHDPDKAIEILIKNFPNEEKGINAYFEQILSKPKSNDSELTVGEFLDSIIKGEDLKLVLLGNLGYFHDDPYSLSLNYYSVAQGSYFGGGGGNFIKGGSQQLSNYLSDFIESNDGKVIFNHTATEIITENNKAVGVVYQNNKTKEFTKVYADDIIVNAAIPNVAKMLLPKEEGNKLSQEIESKTIGASLLTVYFGFKKPLKDIGNKYYSTFIYDDSVKSQKDILTNNKSDFTTRSFTFVDYSQINSALAPKGKSVGALCCIDYTSDWEHLEKEEYKEKKEEVAQIFIYRLEKIIPGIKNAIEYYEVGTALTVKKYTLNPDGAVYGFAQTTENVNAKKIESIDNLHFASAWTKTGGGFSGAIFSGYLCAFDILRNRR